MGRPVLLLAAVLLAGSALLASATYDPATWRPKTNRYTYNPANKDWAGVLSMCKAGFNYEKRLAGFVLRTMFHDGFSVNPDVCKKKDPGCAGWGLDASLLFNVDEQGSDSNNGRGSYFAEVTAKFLLKVAAYYDCSASDVLAMCSMAAMEYASQYRIKFYKEHYGEDLRTFKNFTMRVGRCDHFERGYDNKLSGPLDNPKKWSEFWEERGLSIDDGAALMGVHALLRTQACYKGPGPYDYCDPYKKGDCDYQNLRMYNMDNHYYKDVCTGKITTYGDIDNPQPVPERSLRTMSDEQVATYIKNGQCTFSSYEFKEHFKRKTLLQRAGKYPEDATGSITSDFKVSWTNDCSDKDAGGACPHALDWFYTEQDSLLGKICQLKERPKNTTGDDYLGEIWDGMREYLDLEEWDEAFLIAMYKLTHTYADWTAYGNTEYYVDGNECYSGYVADEYCTNPCVDCSGCKAGARYYPAPSTCDKCCRCKSAYSKDYAYKVEPWPALPDYPDTYPTKYYPDPVLVVVNNGKGSSGKGNNCRRNNGKGRSSGRGK